MNKDIIYVFDGSFYGFLTTVFFCFKDKNFNARITKDSEQQSIIYEYKFIDTNPEKSIRVINGIKSKISEESFFNIYTAFQCEKESVFSDIVKYMNLGFKFGKSVDLYKNIDYVNNVLSARQKVYNEAHLLLGFIRFSETKDNVLYGIITPENDVLEIVSNHFADRLNNEKWIIHDKIRNKAAFYNNEVVIAYIDYDINIEYSNFEEEYRKLWKNFFTTVSIENRKNLKLQKSLLPLKFRKNMSEFNEDNP